MTLHLFARSISRTAAELLQRQPFDARVLAVFAQVCDLVTPEGEVLALVTPAVGDGPLNVVIGSFGPPPPPQLSPAPDRASVAGNSWSWFEHELAVDMPATLDGGKLRVGGWLIERASAEVWEPRPDWAALRARRGAIAGRLGLVKEVVLALTPNSRWGEGRFKEALAALRAGWSGDMVRLQEGAAGLAGLGSGLTPAGDDFLCGAMLWAWIAHPQPAAFCRALVEAAAPRTTTLSAAFLRAAGRGECSAAWHRLLAKLAHTPTPLPQGRDEGLTAAVAAVLAHGATSGADTLAGFLRMALPRGA